MFVTGERKHGCRWMHNRRGKRERESRRVGEHEIEENPIYIKRPLDTYLRKRVREYARDRNVEMKRERVCVRERTERENREKKDT
jgi:hypothetical protein